MTRQKNLDETTLLIKLPPELKASFQGLCKFRGVSVSAELRRFMADEVMKTADGMTTKDKPKNAINARQVVSNPSKVSRHQNRFKNAVQAELLPSVPLKGAFNAASSHKTAKNKKKRPNEGGGRGGTTIDDDRLREH